MEYILGVIASLFVQFLKNKMGTDSIGSLLLVLLVSFVGAATYVLLSDTEFWPVIIRILTVAGAFYAFVIQRFETKTTE